MLSRNLAAAIAVTAWLVAPAAGAETLEPDPAYEPRKVVAIQLDALQSNDTPTENAGIAQAWAFAHPENKAMTGPLPRFERMIQSPRYALLLDHRRHEIEPLSRGETRAVYAVKVTDGDGRVVRYVWEVGKVESGDNAGAWMTLAVSGPKDAGDAI